MSGSVHEQDGAYVLGALSADDRRRYEEHLAGCARCTDSVRQLAALPGLLGVLDPSEAVALRDLPDDAPLSAAAHVPGRTAAVARRVVARRRRARLAGALAVAGVVVLAAAGGLLATRAAAPAPVAAAHELTPVAGSHLFARLSATPVGWGTRLDWSCDYRAPAGEHEEAGAPVSYSLVVRTNGGGESTVATWTSDAGEARGLVAATAIPADAIDRVDIRLTGSTRPLAEAAF